MAREATTADVSAHRRSPGLPSLRLGTAAIALAVVTLGLTGCSGGDDTPAATTTSTVPVETTTTTEVPIEGGEQIFVFEPAVGDCFDQRRLDPETSGNRGQLDIVLKLDCNLPHRYEVFDVLSYGNAYGVYPGDEALQTFANQNCTKNFDAYVGQTYELSEIEVSFWTTPADDWDSGPQTFACTLYDPEAGLTVGSLAGSAR